MKSYTITVNGTVYDVTVEENTNGAPVAPAVSAPIPRKNPMPAPAPAAPASTGAAGSVQITAGAAGKVVDIVASPGAQLKKGDPVVILEIMKMETPAVAQEDGVLATIEVTKGQAVAAGDLLATMN